MPFLRDHLSRHLSRSVSLFFPGILFAVLWSSASVAGKFGLLSVAPLLLFNMRFFGAGVLLLSFVYGFRKERFPNGAEWKHLSIFGALNTTLYLGLFVLALSEVTPGITTLAVALNPLFIGILSAVWAKRSVLMREWIGIAIGIAGVLIAASPHLETNFASPIGLVLLCLSQVAYSVGAVYYSEVEWKLSRMTVNAWQVFIGGILMLPLTLLLHGNENTFDVRFFLSLAWLILPVSVVAVQLWLRLLEADSVRASMWLYLCPVFGFIYAAVLVGEPVSTETFVGTFLVLTALYLGTRK